MHKPSNESSSRRLIEHARADGDGSTAMNLFAEKYWAVVFKWASTYQIEECDAEDIAQNVFLRVLPNLAQFDENKGSFRSWLGKITHNCTMNFFNERTAETKKATPFDPKLLEKLESDVANIGWGKEPAIDEIRRSSFSVIEVFKEDFNDEHWLCFYGMEGLGRTATCIGDELGISAAAVRKRKQRVLNALQTKLFDGENTNR